MKRTGKAFACLQRVRKYIRLTFDHRINITLPREIRDMIYEYVVSSTEPLRVDELPFPASLLSHTHPFLSYLVVREQMAIEAWETMLRTCTFVAASFEEAIWFLEVDYLSIGVSNCAYVRAFQLELFLDERGVAALDPNYVWSTKLAELFVANPMLEEGSQLRLKIDPQYDEWVQLLTLVRMLFPRDLEEVEQLLAQQSKEAWEAIQAVDASLSGQDTAT